MEEWLGGNDGKRYFFVDRDARRGGQLPDEFFAIDGSTTTTSGTATGSACRRDRPARPGLDLARALGRDDRPAGRRHRHRRARPWRLPVPATSTPTRAFLGQRAGRRRRLAPSATTRSRLPEAINAWAGLVLWGEVTGNTALRDLGAWMYATESQAIATTGSTSTASVLAPEYKNVDVAQLFGGKLHPQHLVDRRPAPDHRHQPAAADHPPRPTWATTRTTSAATWTR